MKTRRDDGDSGHGPQSLRPPGKNDIIRRRVNQWRQTVSAFLRRSAVAETHKNYSPTACSFCFTDCTIGSEVGVTICRRGRMILHSHLLMSSTLATMQKYFIGTSTPQRGCLGACGHVKVDWTVEAEATIIFWAQDTCPMQRNSVSTLFRIA